jgi:hypothetical protein
VEPADAQGGGAAKVGKEGDSATKKKAAKKRAPAKRAKRSREKVPQRRRLIWAVLNASMKEEARFPYDQREAAEDKIKQLRAKSEKSYFIQPVKELISEAELAAEAAAAEAAEG